MLHIELGQFVWREFVSTGDVKKTVSFVELLEYSENE
jgi:hypothetical protein